MEVDVLCVGHAAYDLSCFVDSFPAENTKCEFTQMLESGGGPAANAAYLLSKWDIQSGFAGMIGDDSYGQKIKAEFQAVGTDVALMEMRSGYSSPFSAIVVNKQNGSRTIINRKAPAASFQIDQSLLKNSAPKVLLFDGHELTASLEALKAHPKAITILDAGSWREGTAELAGKVHYLAASERFATQATKIAKLDTDTNRRECISQLRERYSTKIIVTLGERGLIANDGSGYLHLPAYPVKTVDTLAAGDIFHGALAFAILKKMPFQESLRFASLAAAISVQSIGGRTSIPSLEKVQEALANAG